MYSTLLPLQSSQRGPLLGPSYAGPLLKPRQLREALKNWWDEEEVRGGQMRLFIRLTVSFEATLNQYFTGTELGKSGETKPVLCRELTKAQPSALVLSLSQCPFHLEEMFPNWLLSPTCQKIWWGFVW